MRGELSGLIPAAQRDFGNAEEPSGLLERQDVRSPLGQRLLGAHEPTLFNLDQRRKAS